MKTIFPKKELHVPKWFILDATGKTLGRLANEASKLLRGKEINYFTPGIDLGNFVVIINSKKIEVSGKKKLQKLYYRNSQTPGNLKIENFEQLKNRIPTRIVEKAIWGMLPKGVLGRQYYKRLYVYSDDQILYSKSKKLNQETKTAFFENKEQNLESSKNWVEVKI
jgi:large subunit ribosomal protein L13